MADGEPEPITAPLMAASPDHTPWLTIALAALVALAAGSIAAIHRRRLRLRRRAPLLLWQAAGVSAHAGLALAGKETLCPTRDLKHFVRASLQQRQHGARDRGRGLGVVPWAVGGVQSGVQIERN